MWKGIEGNLPFLENELEMAEFSTVLNNQTMVSKNNELPTFKHLRTQLIKLSAPFPNGVYQKGIEGNEYPHYTHLDNLTHPLIRSFPNGLFVSESTKIPVMTHLKNLHLHGIARNCTVSKVDLPDSLKEVSENSFYGTKLEEVTLNNEAEYFENSFPDSAEVIGGKFIESDLYNVQ